MPVGIVGLLVLGAVVLLNFITAGNMEAYDNERLAQIYQVPMVIETVDAPGPAVHPLADPAGIIPPAGDEFPSKPSIIGSNDLDTVQIIDSRPIKTGGWLGVAGDGF